MGRDQSAEVKAADSTHDSREVGLTWDRFLQFLHEVVPDLGPTSQPNTTIRDVAPDGLRRAVLLTAIQKVGLDLPEELARQIETLGEAYEWCARKWDDRPFPSDFLSAAFSAATANSRVRLRLIRPADLPILYEAALDPDQGFRWRNRGATPNGHDFERQLYNGTLAQFIVEECNDSAKPRSIGLVAAYRARFDNGTAWLAFQKLIPDSAHGKMFEGMFLFVEYVFRTWNFRKLYAEIPGYNLASVTDVLSTFLVVEGTLADHEYHDGKWWDLVIAVVDHHTWEKQASKWRAHLGGSDAPHANVYQTDRSF